MTEEKQFSLEDVVPPEVYSAIKVLVDYQEKHTCTIRFSFIEPFVLIGSRVTERFLLIKIENLSRKLIKKWIKAGARRGYSCKGEAPEIYQTMRIDDIPVTLSLVGDFEYNAQKRISDTAQKHGQAMAEAVAGKMLAKYGIDNSEDE